MQELLGGGSPWVGQFLPVVAVDEWGSFRFLLLRMRDSGAGGGGRGGGGGLLGGGERQRIVLRGRNCASESQLQEEVNREVRPPAGVAPDGSLARRGWRP